MPNADLPRILMLQQLPAAEAAQLARVAILDNSCPSLRDPAGADPAILAAAELCLTNGGIGFNQAMFAACPNLRLIQSFASGHEGIDLDEARSRGIPVVTCHGANADSVADHALALALSVMRGLSRFDRDMRAGTWRQIRDRPQLAGKRVGILGLGAVGLPIAKRVEAFGTRIAYSATAPKPRMAWDFYPDALSLAGAVDVLFVCCRADISTRHLVDRAVLTALGPSGFLVNVSRGLVVDTEALLEALESGTIAGAGLDVLEQEGAAPDFAARFDNLLITPHIASGSPESRQAMVDMVVGNVAALSAGRPLVNRVA